MSIELGGRVALVTGGGRGIGAGIARHLAAAGASVVVCDVDAEAADALAQEIGGISVTCDVSSLEANRTAVAAATQRFGGLDVVVLNAGVSTGFLVDDLDEELYRRAMGVNLDGVVFGVSAALPALRRRGGGDVVVTASLAGLAPVPVDPVYAANKAAVVNYVRSVAPVLAPEGIRVNAVCPGFTDTAIVDPLRDLLAAGEVPLMRVEDVVRAVDAVLNGRGSGEAWLVQHGMEPAPYRFRGIPGPRGGSPASGDEQGSAGGSRAG